MFRFGKRKVQKVRYTHTITLPPEWVTNVGIGKGGDVVIEMDEQKRLIITPATPCKDAASAFTVFLLFAKIVLCHVLNMLFSTLTSLSNVFMGLSAVLLSRKVYKTICTINFKVILMGGVIGPAEMERIRKNREKKKKSQ